MTLKLNKVFLYFALCTLYFVLFHAYQYAHWEQTFYIPMIKHLINPTYLFNDWFVNLTPYHTNVLNLTAFLSKVSSLPLATLILYVFSIFTYLVSSYLISFELFSNRKTALLSTFLLAIIVPHGLGGSRMLQASFSPRLLGISFLLLSLLFLLQKKYVFSFILAFICSQIHLLIGLNWLFILSFYYLFISFKAKKFNTKEIFLIILGFIFFLLPNILTQIKILQAQPFLPYFKDIFININAQLRFPHHYLLLHTGPLGILYFFLIAILLLKGLQLITDPDKKLLLKFILLSLVSFLVINILFVDLFPSSFIAKFQPLRLSYLLQYFFILFFAHFLIKTNDYYSRTFPVFLYLFILSIPISVITFPENYKILTIIFIFLLFIAFLKYLPKLRINNLFADNNKLLIFILLSFVLGLFLNFSLTTKKPQFFLPKKDFSAWVDIAYWAKEHTYKNAVFIAPPHLEGFRIYSDRAIVANFKACPYLEKDAEEWKKRLDDLTNSDISKFKEKGWNLLPIIENKYNNLSINNIFKISRKYQARYIIMTNKRPLNFQQLYKNQEFSLYRI